MIEFFTKEEGELIIQSIREAEIKTSGEIRVHLEDNSKRKTIKDAAIIFNRLGMKKTKDRNGILFLLIPERKEFAIYGDVGINKKVPEGYWTEVVEHVQTLFREGKYVAGLCDGIGMVGEKLKIYFPYEIDDKNELSDEISYG